MWKLVEKMQLVGTSDRFAFFRDLYEKDGKRVSIRTSEYFDIETQRKLGENYPPREVMFARFSLPESKINWEPLR